MKIFLVPFVALFSVALGAQATATRDAAAAAFLARSVTAMGGSVPTDSIATGSVAVTSGSSTETGTYRHLTRGTDQTLEKVSLPSSDQSKIFNGERAALKSGASVTPKSLQWAASAESPVLPIVFLSKVLQDPDFVFASEGQEIIGGTLTNKIRIWSTYASKSNQSHLSPLSEHRVWLDASTGLPVRIEFTRKEAEGATAGIRNQIELADYRSVNGVLFPFSIHESVNGTPWAAISIQSVTFNNGLTDTDFATE